MNLANQSREKPAPASTRASTTTTIAEVMKMAVVIGLAMSGARTNPGVKHSPAFVAHPGAEATVKYAAGLNDATGEQHKQCSRKADQPMAAPSF